MSARRARRFYRSKENLACWSPPNSNVSKQASASRFRYWILRFYIDLGPFTRRESFHFGSYRRILQAQFRTRDNPKAPGRYIGASPRRLGRPTRISAVQELCKEHCKLSVFGELRSNNGGLLAAGENRKVFRKPLNPLPCPAVWQCTSLCRWRPKPHEWNAELTGI